MDTIETLNAISRCYGECSDYRISKMMGVSRAHVSELRNNKRTMSENMRIAAAKLLNEEPDQQLLYGRIERAKDKQVKMAWKHVLEKLTHTAAAVILALGLTSAPQSVEASQDELQGLYIM